MSSSKSVEPLPVVGKAHDAGGAATSTNIPKELIITGIIECRGAPKIFGLVDGNVDAAILVVGNSGKITGEVLAQSATVNGHIEGDINFRSRSIASEGVVLGDIASEHLSVEHGAEFRNGRPAQRGVQRNRQPLPMRKR